MICAIPRKPVMDGKKRMRILEQGVYNGKRRGNLQEHWQGAKSNSRKQPACEPQNPCVDDKFSDELQHTLSGRAPYINFGNIRLCPAMRDSRSCITGCGYLPSMGC